MNIVGNTIVLIGLVMVSVLCVCIVSDNIVMHRMHDKFKFSIKYNRYDSAQAQLVENVYAPFLGYYYQTMMRFILTKCYIVIFSLCATGLFTYQGFETYKTDIIDFMSKIYDWSKTVNWILTGAVISLIIVICLLLAFVTLRHQMINLDKRAETLMTEVNKITNGCNTFVIRENELDSYRTKNSKVNVVNK